MKLVFSALIIIMLVPVLFAQDDEATSTTATLEAVEATDVNVVVEEPKVIETPAPEPTPAEIKKVHESNTFLNVNTKIKNPMDLRDPFKKKAFNVDKKKTDWEAGFMEKSKGFFSNIDDISNVPLSNIYVVGILMGKTRRALVKVGNDPKSLSGQAYILKEGMKLGEDEAELKAILPGGIVLVQKIKNIYEQDEYLETVIPLIAEQQ